MPDFQQSSEIIHLSDGWEYWDGSPVYEEGSREKSSVICKLPRPPGLIRPGWRYLFKQSRSIYPWQYWMEIAAYRIGGIMNVDVPPSHVAIDFDGFPGSLTEWMFNASEENQGLILAGEFMLRRDPQYDRIKGKVVGHCHNLELVLPVVRFGKGITHFIKMLVFDTLIANTDRHHDNWGLLWNIITSDNDASVQELNFDLGPAFDNGTSLGHERLEGKLPIILADSRWFRNHATRAAARHHIRLHPDDVAGAPMLELLPELLRRFPDFLPTVQACATFSDEDIRQVIFPLCDFDMPVRLSENRAEFICRMVCTRRDMLLERLEQHAQA